MKWLIDTNILLAAANAGHPHHAHDSAWLATNRKDGWGVTTEGYLGAIRILMNPVAMKGAHLGARDAVTAVSSALAAPHKGQIIIGGDPDNALLKTARGHRQVMDFYLAQVARDTGLKLATRDAGLLAAFPKIAVHPARKP
jgi:predicted nucleic acid-binding protein